MEHQRGQAGAEGFPQYSMNVLGKTSACLRLSGDPGPKIMGDALGPLFLRASVRSHCQQGDIASLLGISIRLGNQRPVGSLIPLGWGALKTDPVSWRVGLSHQVLSDIGYSWESIHSFTLFICSVMSYVFTECLLLC